MLLLEYGRGWVDKGNIGANYNYFLYHNYMDHILSPVSFGIENRCKMVVINGSGGFHEVWIYDKGGVRVL